MKLIRFRYDRNGRPYAEYWMNTGTGRRWVRMNYDQAKIEVATGAAHEYVPGEVTSQ